MQLIFQTIVFSGETGSGKSRTAAAICGEDVYYKPHGKWWDGYDGQQSVIVDDFYGWMQYDEVLRVTDRYPHRVEVKGGFKEFTSKKIIFTSNKSPRDWWKKEENGGFFNEDRWKPLKRRLDIWEDFSIINGEINRTDMLIEFNFNEFFQ